MTGGMVMWRAGCGESRTSGSEGGPGKRTRRKACTAPCARPYFGAYLWRAAPADELTSAVYRSLEPSLLHELDLAFFEDRFEGATPAEQAVLAAMARKRTAVDVADLRRALPDQASLDTLVRRLVERGLLYRTGRARYDFALPMFRAYLGRRDHDRTELTDSVRAVRTDPPRADG
jgi:hypothetical protein